MHPGAFGCIRVHAGVSASVADARMTTADASSVARCELVNVMPRSPIRGVLRIRRRVAIQIGRQRGPAPLRYQIPPSQIKANPASFVSIAAPELMPRCATGKLHPAA